MRQKVQNYWKNIRFCDYAVKQNGNDLYEQFKAPTVERKINKGKGKPEGKRPLGRPRRRWVDNIRMDLQEVGCGYMDWIGWAQDRVRWRTLVSAVMNLRVP